MKTQAVCAQCFSDALKSGDEPEVIDVEITDLNPIEFTCSQLHKTYWFLELDLHEKLFKLALKALDLEFNREAVLNFASSIERFHEMVIRIVCVQMDVELQTIEKLLKDIKLSERQTGAYLTTMALFTKSSPRDITSHCFNGGKTTMIGFRNAVAHNGKIPKNDEALAYGKASFDYIQEVINLINEKAPDAFNRYRLLKYQAQSDKLRDGKVLFGGDSSKIGFNSNDLRNLTFDELLNEVRKNHTPNYF